MSVEVYNDLGAIPPRTARRLSIEAGVPFFKSIEWFRCLIEHGLPEQRLAIFIDQNPADRLSVLFCTDNNGQLHSLSNFYTIEYGPFVRGGGLGSIMRFIADSRQKFSSLDLRNLQESDLALLSDHLADAGFRNHPWPQYQNWFLAVGGRSFEQYYQQRNSKLRNTIERRQRKAQRQHELRIAIYPSADINIEQAIAHFQTVYSASWKQDEPFPGFMPALMQCCDRLQLARIGLAWIDDKPAAAQFWITERNRAVIYKLAYDEQFAHLSPGSLLSRSMFEHAIDVDRVKEIDYGTGDEAYKRDWMSDSRQLSGLLACNLSTLKGRLLHWRQCLADLKSN
ncbi:MAG: GNAT family N-acetyltransferase [Gammaproteobacteria bacterium]|nr:GNAT family N-acetyltransferase [Gammaproteobacteria bacterium]